MAISAPQYQAWLESSNVVRVLLVQVTSNVGTFYIATTGITVSGQYYSPCVVGDFTITSGISEDYSSAISYSDLAVHNPNGERDDWLDYIWDNKSIKIYYGDASWTDLTNDFRLIFDGIIGTLDSKDRFTLNFTIRDALQKLNYPISENKLGNYNPLGLSPFSNPNLDVIKPLVFGEVFNITPILTSESLLEYMVCDGAVESIMEVRDNGVPVSFVTTDTPTIPAGSFRLVRTPVGEITASVQGRKISTNLTNGASSATYVNTVTNVIATIILQYGKGLTTASIDWTNFSTVGASTIGSVAVGIYLQDRFNVFSLCDSLAKSVGLCLTTSSSGKIQLSPIAIPGSSTNNITNTDIILNSLRVGRTMDVKGSTKLGYAKNWTVQTNLLTGIPEAHKEEYAKEWREVNITNATVITNYGLATEDIVEESYLVDLTDATNVANTKLGLVTSQHRVFQLTCTAKHMQLVAGSSVFLTSDRFGLASGKYGVVLSSTPRWLDNQIDIEVLV